MFCLDHQIVHDRNKCYTQDNIVIFSIVWNDIEKINLYLCDISFNKNNHTYDMEYMLYENKSCHHYFQVWIQKSSPTFYLSLLPLILRGLLLHKVRLYHKVYKWSIQRNAIFRWGFHPDQRNNYDNLYRIGHKTAFCLRQNDRYI